MVDKQCPNVKLALTGNGTADGYITVSSNANLVVQAQCFIFSDTQDPVAVVITELVSTDTVGLRIASEVNNYGRSDMSAFLVADNATILQYAQEIDTDSGASDSANAITGMTGDVSSTGVGGIVTTTVNSVGGSTAAAVNAATVLANSATSVNTPNTIVMRDGSGVINSTLLTTVNLSVGTSLITTSNSAHTAIMGPIAINNTTGAKTFSVGGASAFAQSFRLPTRGNVALAVEPTAVNNMDIMLYVSPPTLNGSLSLGTFNSTLTGSASIDVINNNDTSNFAHAVCRLAVVGANGGLPYLALQIAGVKYWAVGLDNRAGQAFKVSAGGAPGSDDKLTIATDGTATFTGDVHTSLGFFGASLNADVLNLTTTGNIPTLEANTVDSTLIIAENDLQVGFDDESGVPGDATINLPSGKVSLLGGQSTVTITNSIANANSRVFANLVQVDGTVTSIKTAHADGGTIVITVNGTAAVDGGTIIQWLLLN